MQPNFLIAMKFLSMISTTCKCMQSNLLVAMGVQCMVNINIIVEGHSISMHACEQIPKALKMDGICQCFYWMQLVWHVYKRWQQENMAWNDYFCLWFKKLC